MKSDSAMTMNDLPALPRDKEGPVFTEPWEAQAFALAVCLSEVGCFTWPEWVAILSQEIKAAQERGDPDLGNTYYQHWLNALKRVAGKLVRFCTLRHRALLFSMIRGLCGILFHSELSLL